MKKIFSGITLLAAIFFTVTGCFIEDDPGDLGKIIKSGAYGNGTFTDTVTGQGLGYAGYINVSLEIELGIIKDVKVTHNETAGIGAAFIKKVTPIIIAANSFEIDAITKATCKDTANGLLEAGRDAISKIPPGVE